MGRGGSIELWLAGITILGITLVYLVGVALFQTIPAAGGLFGHLIGIVGFFLMICTEILYTLRKQSRNARWGRMSTWLQAHIFIGLVGPFMVLLHSSWKFNGLAGVVMLLTVIIVASGFIGRYIYTAVPRNLDGAMVDLPELERQILAVQTELERMITDQPGLARLVEPAVQFDLARADGSWHVSWMAGNLNRNGARCSTNCRPKAATF